MKYAYLILIGLLLSGCNKGEVTVTGADELEGEVRVSLANLLDTTAGKLLLEGNVIAVEAGGDIVPGTFTLENGEAELHDGVMVVKQRMHILLDNLDISSYITMGEDSYAYHSETIVNGISTANCEYTAPHRFPDSVVVGDHGTYSLECNDTSRIELSWVAMAVGSDIGIRTEILVVDDGEVLVEEEDSLVVLDHLGNIKRMVSVVRLHILGLTIVYTVK